MCTEKHVLVKKIFTHLQNIDLSLRTCVQKTVHKEETHWLSCKKKCSGRSGQWRSSYLLGTNRPIILIFLKKGVTVNSSSYCQLLRQNSPYLLNNSCNISLQRWINKSVVYKYQLNNDLKFSLYNFSST